MFSDPARHAGLLGEPDERERRERRVLGRLCDDGAAGGQRRRDLARDHRRREVPRRDRGDHADRLLQPRTCVRPHRRGDDVAVGARRFLGEPLDVGSPHRRPRRGLRRAACPARARSCRPGRPGARDQRVPALEQSARAAWPASRANGERRHGGHRPRRAHRRHRCRARWPNIAPVAGSVTREAGGRSRARRTMRPMKLRPAKQIVAHGQVSHCYMRPPPTARRSPAADFGRRGLAAEIARARALG